MHYVETLLHFLANGLVGSQHNYWQFRQWEIKTIKTQSRAYAFFKFFINSVFKKLTNFISSVVGDSCSTNHALLQEFDSKCLGCNSHRFYQAVKDYVMQHATFVDKVHYIMTKLSSQILVVKLRI